jgi:hypothetical protein
MPRRSASEPNLGEPGGVWVWRGGSSLANEGKKIVEKPPKNEAAAVAWKAIRKPTLHGQLGTHNKISSVIQYPCCNKDPFNMYQGSLRHLSAEDRRIMRVMIKHSLRHSPHYPDAVYEVERKLIDGMGKHPHLKAAFFTNHDFANKTLAQMAFTVDSGGFGKDAEHQEPLPFEAPAHIVPTKHHYACGPQCFCNKYQDAALLCKVTELPGDFEDTFANKTKSAQSMLVENLAASRRKRSTATM